MDPNASLSILRMGGLKTMKNKSCSILRLQFGTSAENDLSFIAVPNYVWITDLVTITWKKKWNGQNIFSWPSQVLYHCTLVSSFKFHLDLKTGYAWLEASHWNDTIKVCHFCCDKEENEVVIITFSVIADIRYDFFLFIFWEKITREGESYLNLRTMLEKCYKRHKLIVKKINLDTEARKPYFKIVKWWSNQESAVGGTKQLFFKLECFTGWVTQQQHKIWEKMWPSVAEGFASPMPIQANRVIVRDHFFRCCHSNTGQIFRSIKKGEKKWKDKSVMMPSPTTLLRPPGKGWCPNLKRVKILNVAQQITKGNLKARNQA